MIYIAGNEKSYVRDKFKNDKRHKFKKENLIIGDYIVGNYIIERKQINDLYSSLAKGSLFRQLEKLQKFAQEVPQAKPILLIEGFKIHKKLQNIAEVMPLHEIVANCLVIFDISVIKTSGLNDTVNFIKELDSYVFNNVRHVIQDVRGFKPKKSISNQQKYFLQGLPTIGPRRVEQIMKRYKSPIAYFMDVITIGTNIKVKKVLTGENNE